MSKCSMCEEKEITTIEELEDDIGMHDITSQLDIVDLEVLGDTRSVFMTVYPVHDDKWNIEEMVTNACPPSWKEMFTENSAIIRTISNRLSFTSSVLPEARLVFRAFRECPLSSVKVVIVAQDPYYTRDTKGRPYAQGIAFSILKDQKPTSSMSNIMKELKREGFSASGGDLTGWIRQGVFLMNVALTVEEGSPNSHSGIWNSFAERVIEWISRRRSKSAYMLWGRSAQRLRRHISSGKVFTSSHPSGRSASRGFDGCDHFKKCNLYLESVNETPIDWNIY